MEKKYVIFLFILSCLGSSYAQSISRVYEKVNPAVVVVYTESTTIIDADTDSLKMMSSISPVGSGVMISESEIITSAHLIHVADKVKVEFLDGEIRNAEVIAHSESADLAMIQLETPKEGAVTVSLGNSHELRHGTPIFVVVAPKHLEHSVSVGGVKKVIKNKKGTKGIDYVNITAPLDSGYMGGPMFNLKGEVMGIVSHLLNISSEIEDIPYVITSNTVKDLLIQELLEWNGIDARPVTGVIARRYNLPQKTGLLVEHIESLSPLGKMGVQRKDIILSLANTKVELKEDTLEKMHNIYHKLRADQAFEMMILRGDKMVFLNRE